MHQLSTDKEATIPVGAELLCRDFYFDGLISGASYKEEHIAADVRALVQSQF